MNRGDIVNLDYNDGERLRTDCCKVVRVRRQRQVATVSGPRVGIVFNVPFNMLRVVDNYRNSKEVGE